MAWTNWVKWQGGNWHQCFNWQGFPWVNKGGDRNLPTVQVTTTLPSSLPVLCLTVPRLWSLVTCFSKRYHLYSKWPLSRCYRPQLISQWLSIIPESALPDRWLYWDKPQLSPISLHYYYMDWLAPLTILCSSSQYFIVNQQLDYVMLYFIQTYMLLKSVLSWNSILYFIEKHE